MSTAIFESSIQSEFAQFKYHLQKIATSFTPKSDTKKNFHAIWPTWMAISHLIESIQADFCHKNQKIKI